MFSSNTSQVSSDAVYVEDVFSNFLYTGAGGAQTVSTGIDLATYGGLLWNKNRTNAISNVLTDTVRGANAQLVSNTTAAQGNYGVGLSFLTNGFSFSSVDSAFNTNGANYASWSFRKQPKFFDVVTYTGTGSNYRAISHSLGSTPGMVIVKSTSASGAWAVWHRSTDPNNLILNSTSAAISGQYSIQDVGSTSFAVANSSFYGFPQSIPVNDNGATYVAYLFAHNAGGFGLTGTDNVISCGSFTLGTTTADVNLGWEPQWILFKRTNSVSDWRIYDTMRGWTTDGNDQRLQANVADAEDALTSSVKVTSTGFFAQGLGTSNSYIYIAIRRGPMKTPTTGTSVFVPYTYTGDGASTRTFSIGLNPVDMVWQACRSSATYNYNTLTSRLQGTNGMTTAGTGAEFVSNQAYDVQTGIRATGFENTLNQSGQTFVMEGFRRAPGFFDVVCYTGTGSARTVTHNLGVVPELMIVKCRNQVSNWMVYHSALGNTKAAYLDSSTTPYTSSAWWNNTTPTASVFTVGTDSYVNNSADTYVAYLFASCPSVSKVGSYTGTGTTQQINCGFTSGARFVLIKRTDSTGDWYVWDSARGIVAGNDPYLLLNSTAAEVTNTDYVDTYSAGFEISSTAPAAINASGGSFIYLAIA